jgi:hypothetical protein
MKVNHGRDSVPFRDYEQEPVAQEAERTLGNGEVYNSGPMLLNQAVHSDHMPEREKDVLEVEAADIPHLSMI